MSTRLMMALALAVAPAAYAHTPEGTPKNYCEDPSEWGSHDYAVGVGSPTFLPEDGNLAGDCDGDTLPADFDGHSEWAGGGVWLDVDSGDGVTGGSIACYGVVGHHAQFGPFTLTDAVFGPTLPFYVAADQGSLVPPTDPAQPNCGDFETDESTECIGTCSVTFPPGVDGGYIIFAGNAVSPGTVGHVDGGWLWSGAPGEGDGADSPSGCGLSIGSCKGRCTVNIGYCSKKCQKPVNVGEC